MYGASQLASVAMSEIVDENGATTTIETTSTTTTPFIAVSFDATGNGFFAGNLTATSGAFANLAVTGTTTLSGLLVNTIGIASSTLDMLSDVTFFGRPYFTTDTAGGAVIKSGARSVDIVFDREYIDTPVVSATITLESASSTEEIEQAIFENDIRFIVTRKNVHGFTVLLNKNATTDISFSWIALAVKNAKLFTSRDLLVAPIETATTTPPVIVPIVPIIPIEPITPVPDLTPTTTPPVIDTNSTTTPPVINTTSTSTPPVTEQGTTTPEVISNPEPIIPPTETTPIVENPPVEQPSSEPAPTPEPIPTP
jgi:hypothetical protein